MQTLIQFVQNFFPFLAKEEKKDFEKFNWIFEQPPVALEK